MARTEVASRRSADLSGSSVAESCPPVYEEIIQQLEADVRKHIRIEHQLKLHIESVEDRVEELERDLAKFEDDESENNAGAKVQLDELRSKYDKQNAIVKDLEQ